MTGEERRVRCGAHDSISVSVPCRNQEEADRRLPLLLSLAAARLEILCVPMEGPVDLSNYLTAQRITRVLCAGASGPGAVPLEFSWVRDLRTCCVRAGVPFLFLRTGSIFSRNGKRYRIPREAEASQAEKSGFCYTPGQNDGAKIRYTLPEKNALRNSLAASPFRARFHLSAQERAYFLQKGTDVIEQHARDFVQSRLAPENPPKDGKQTPMRGHPVFKAQHATACCCRSCLEKWHHIPSGKALTEAEQDYIVRVLMDWIEREMLSKR